MDIVTRIKNVLQKESTIGIVSHIHADGDCLGAQLGLKMALEALGKTVTCYNAAGLPRAYAFMAGYDDVQPLPKHNAWPDLMVAVDCGSLERIGISDVPAHATIINIDHHAGNTRFGHLNWIDENAPATCEMIVDLLRSWPLSFTPDMATVLFTGISTDTGSFKYHQTSAHTFENAAFLRKSGADLDAVRLHVYENMNRGQFAILQHVLANAAFFGHGKIVVSDIDYATITRMQPGETSYSSMVAQLKEIEGVEVAVLLRELDDGAIKVSLRSKAFFDVNAFAETYHGGGHIRAAGVILRTSMKAAQVEIVQALIQALEREDQQV